MNLGTWQEISRNDSPATVASKLQANYRSIWDLLKRLDDSQAALKDLSLDDLSGVVLPSATDGDFFRYISTTWTRWTPAAATLVTDFNADLLDGNHAAAFSLSGHNHDDRYYTETELTNYSISLSLSGLSVKSAAPLITFVDSDSNESRDIWFTDTGLWAITDNGGRNIFWLPEEALATNTIQLYNTYSVWHSGNDGIGSTLDADLLDGQQGSYYNHGTGTTNKLAKFTDTTTIGDSTIYDAGAGVGIGTILPDCTLHVFKGSAGTVAAASYSVICAEHSDSAAISILTPNDKIGHLLFGDPDLNNVGELLYNHDIDAMGIVTAGEVRVWIDSNGDVGIGKIPENWGAGFSALQIGGLGALWTQTAEDVGSPFQIACNIYAYGATFKRFVNDGAAYMALQSGTFQWYTDGAGEADVGYTPTERMRLTATGQLGIGCTPSDTLLDVDINLNDIAGILLRATGVDHGMTGYYPTDVWGAIDTRHTGCNRAGGGMRLVGMSDVGSAQGLSLHGVMGLGSSSVTAVELMGARKNNTGWQAIGTTDYVMQLLNYDTPLITVLGNGQIGLGCTPTEFADDAAAATGGI